MDGEALTVVRYVPFHSLDANKVSLQPMTLQESAACLPGYLHSKPQKAVTQVQERFTFFLNRFLHL